MQSETIVTELILNGKDHYFARKLEISRPGEAVALRCSVKTKFLEISQDSQENTSARISF